MAEMDPEDPAEVDRHIRINELKEQANELVGGAMVSFESEDMPSEISEQFWQNVVDIERGGWTSSRKQLQEDGVALPPPEELSDADLAAKMDEIFTRLAARNTFFTHTDHLSDRQLYDHLLEELLDEEFPDMQAVSPNGAYIIDLVGSGSEEDMLTYLRYHAGPEDRQSWQKDYPGEKMPPHEQPPYDRDHRLPPPPEGW
jgi:hypothetical protein